ncbi:MAG: 16S rRNA (guanine(527)-N(7))-methyltransferase RsmG [Bacteroidales bacterium]|uniref:16S rRNA (guanine(527)-N(7))-methyltransferase RsmG n=1 Tax=Porphyromonas sp. TaxID=1924944 RepID=UPI002978F0CF|nr:16S rRNA (guanine(527)-N(7))-methyltransferase RsmG [Porphyromonas sp.]MDD7437749.1 16S rRNA (guanine(527)-N(7))-methyltransferase RsmG [Bacteroidales bacterium]MDY3066586.1 16S rRNA (guanine(527)-N(7))-methyltransferase RsmG [Porphyromonas sp.]
MNSTEKALIVRYFPNLTVQQREQLELLPNLYREWNAKINIISRKDIDNIVPNHILHSMSIGLFTGFKDDTQIFDVGTGGGLPGIPLAILFPKCRFTLIDSIGKKIKVASNIAESIGLSNVETIQARAEEIKGKKCHFLVSRAAMVMSDLMKIGTHLVDKREQFNALPNGVIALKGGDLSEELRPYHKIALLEEVSGLIPDVPFFETKKIIYISL